MIKMEQNQDPLEVASNVYKLVNENDRMRVFRVTFQPGDTAKMHHHPQHMAYVLKGGKLNLSTASKSQETELKEGSAVFLEAQNHEATNTGNTVVDLVVVELKD